MGGQVKTQYLHSAWTFSLTGVNVPSIIHCNVKNKSGKEGKINQKQVTARTAERVSIFFPGRKINSCKEIKPVRQENYIMWYLKF